MTAFNRKSSFTTVVKLLNIYVCYTFRFNEELRARQSY